MNVEECGCFECGPLTVLTWRDFCSIVRVLSERLVNALCFQRATLSVITALNVNADKQRGVFELPTLD